MKTRDVVLIGVFIALSYVLSFIKFQGSISLDSAPAFLAVFLFRDYKGAIIGSVGHLMSASMAGFFFTLPVHIVIAIFMFVMLYLAAFIARKFNLVLTAGIIFMFNTFILPVATFISFPVDAYAGFVVALAPAVILNLIIAAALYKPVGGVLFRNASR